MDKDRSLIFVLSKILASIEIFDMSLLLSLVLFDSAIIQECVLLVSMIARKLARTRNISLSLAKTKFNTFRTIQILSLEALTTLLYRIRNIFMDCSGSRHLLVTGQS